MIQQEEKYMEIYEELKARGLIAQVTDEPQIRELINNGGARFYIGFDPTADSLHVGHFMALVPDETAADGWEQAGRSVGRWHGLYRRPLRADRYALHDVAGDHPPQLRLLQKTDGTIY